ncbi:NAD(P)-binding domain-containing protein [Actomonas aquatica]|uniref:NAD(P)-binding domain-containing protein n=1 Tax=Actomonas aquatica TaxID=2866162 RepID=A0ABZ1C838_9BACT|nr:NAD(P)-binding domain-containing protein [Opitutus sp. WL0086]WRQ87853.1 NAD(P)-binding domain-containing protein [Opitutus sp. WL0086]
MSRVRNYLNWLHLQWPAGKVDKLPEVNADGTTAVPGVRVVGDLTGVPLLKFSADSGAKAVEAIAAELGNDIGAESGPVDVAIIGAGVAGIAAALEAKKRGLRFAVFEATAAFTTITNFPKAKPIYTYPTDMVPAGDLHFRADVKEDLLAELEQQRSAAGIEYKRVRIERVERRGGELRLHHAGGEPFLAKRVIVAIGRSGNHRKLGVPGEDREHVFNRLHDPAEFAGRDVVVVGGGDSAVEAAVALAQADAKVTLSYRGDALVRAKPENVAALEGSGVRLMLKSQLTAIETDSVTVKPADAAAETVPADAVFALIGREAPLDFFRRSGIPIQGETTKWGWVGLAAMLLFAIFIYTWKSGGPTESWIDPAGFASSLQEQVEDRSTIVGTLAVSLHSRSFYYTLLYSSLILWFGIARIRRRRTPYVRRQTIALMVVQWMPLFILPEIILPWAGYNGAFSGGGVGEAVGDALFEKYVSPEEYAVEMWPENGHPRAYWRAYGLILAWPLNVYNVFTQSPHWWWIGIGLLQTAVLIPWMVRRWGKGAYCGWICSCGALAETMGDRHRHKMPHGPGWNKVNVIGQVFLAVAFALLAVRVVGWVLPGSWFDRGFDVMLEGKLDGQTTAGWFLSYKWFVDVLWAGVIGVAFYFKYSGRVWCRFACPLAALMHIYARFSRFRIFSEKKKCISCNVCTSVCHQGIDVMAFANRGVPMEDPECVRCSACVQSCPTGVLSFGRLLADGKPLFDDLEASPVRMQESALARR